MCGVVCVKVAHSSIDDHEEILITHLIIIIKSEISTFPVVVIFSVVGCLMWLYHNMLTVSYIPRESLVYCPLLLCSLTMCANNQMHYDLVIVFICLQITLPHYDLSEGTELLKCLSCTFCLECVSIFSIIFHAIHGAVCIQLTHLSYDDCENTCTLSYYHHEIGSMRHLPLFRVRLWNNGTRRMSFYIHMSWTHYWSAYFE